MDLEQLEKLRRMNQDHLHRLKANQEEFRKRLAGGSRAPSLKSKGETPENKRAPDSQIGKENQDRVAEEFAGVVRRASREAGPQFTRPGLGPPSKPTVSRKEEGQETRRQGGRHPASERAEETSVLSAREGESARAAGEMVQKRESLGDPERKTVPASPTDSEMHPAHLQRPRGGVEPSPAQAEGSRGPRASARMPRAPKSILLTPRCKESKEKTKKEAGCVTFASDPEETSLPADEWSVRPFLGYDWIAGLLDLDSSVSEKPEQYFSELQDFRRVNRDTCIHDGYLRSAALGSSVLDQELETESTSHQCVFCYRLNKRLFAVPLGSESACPICKTLRTQQPPETLVEPAFVRVSIPRSTLLPAYRHKIHRRKSYEPADDLALLSHCLAGWENPIQAFSPTPSSLDLRTTLATKSSGHLDWREQIGACSRYLHLHCQLVLRNLLDDTGGARIQWSSWQPWICMCNLHKQARIRHLVAWATKLPLPLQASPEAREFWEEKPCSPEECVTCRPEDCPGSSPPFESLPLPGPYDSRILLPPILDSESYDSLPVVDDMGEE